MKKLVKEALSDTFKPKSLDDWKKQLERYYFVRKMDDGTITLSHGIAYVTSVAESGRNYDVYYKDYDEKFRSVAKSNRPLSVFLNQYVRVDTKLFETQEEIIQTKEEEIQEYKEELARLKEII
jgi:hypothetical protein